MSDGATFILEGREVVVRSPSKPPCEACGSQDHGAYRIGRTVWLCKADFDAAIQGQTAPLKATVRRAREEDDRPV